MDVLLFLLFLFFVLFFIDLELMSLLATKRRHSDFNKAYSSAWLLILNCLIM